LSLQFERNWAHYLFFHSKLFVLYYLAFIFPILILSYKHIMITNKLIAPACCLRDVLLDWSAMFDVLSQNSVQVKCRDKLSGFTSPNFVYLMEHLQLLMFCCKCALSIFPAYELIHLFVPLVTFMFKCA
jgi:hypothetical protein